MNNSEKGIVNHLRDVYATAEVCRFTAAQLFKSLADARAPLAQRTEAGRRKFTRQFYGYVAGYCDAKYSELWGKVEFCYRDAAGVIYSTHKQSVHRSTEEFYAAGRGSELGDLECAHVWKGTDRPFTPWEVPNNRGIEGAQ